MGARGNIEYAKHLLEHDKGSTYREIAKICGCSYGTVAKLGKEIRGKKKSKRKIVDDETVIEYWKSQANAWEEQHDDLMKKFDERGEEIEIKEKALKSQKITMEELEKQIDEWKWSANEWMEKHRQEKKATKAWEELNRRDNKKLKQLEAELKACRTVTDLEMIKKLNESIKLKDESIQELDRACKRADQERDEAMAYAQEMKDQLQEHMKKYKTDIEAYEETFSHMKEKHNRLLDYVRVSG